LFSGKEYASDIISIKNLVVVVVVVVVVRVVAVAAAVAVVNSN
jgi:hypothetical protein